ncbi:MAG: Nif3-like dinuclear metal center hexameric protein [Deltaproteobacteria bacterium]|nr:MAG: Nif3-like dinuclear metal center hexameric protein [Deltaproteobacteria bacterium]
MAVKVGEILEELDDFAPFSLSESWDNTGLLIGSAEMAVSSILLGLDPCESVISEAAEKKCNLVITHHPIIFKPLSSIDTGTVIGRLIQKALQNSISVIACHTNLDNTAYGVSDALGNALGITGMSPIIPSGNSLFPGSGSGRIGTLEQEVSGRHFLQRIMDSLGLDRLQVAGRIPERINRAAVCGGSGSGFAVRAKELGADIYLTAEVKHDTARWAEDEGFCIVDGTHYATERLAVHLLHEKLTETARKNNWNIKIIPTETERHPFVSVDKNSL